MEKFVRGSVVVIPFPFSDLSATKRRPALVLANLADNDILLCQITSQYKETKHVVPLEATDFTIGSLPVNSYIRPERIFTADKSIILKTVGLVSGEILNKTVENIINILTDYHIC